MDIVNAFKGLSALLWLVTGGLFLALLARAGKKQPLKPISTVFLLTALGAVVVTTVAAGLVFVPPQERGVVISAIAPDGYRKEALTPGLHWIIPYAEYVVYYPISKQTYTMSSTPTEGAVEGDDSIQARTADGQLVYMDASVIFSIDPARVVEVHIAWQDRYAHELVRPLVRGVIRDAVSQFRIEEVISTKRFDLEQMIAENLAQRLADNGLILEDFVLRNIAFTEEYAQAIEQKQIAEQRALQAKFVVEQKKQEAEQARQVAQGQADAAVIKAKGDAEARVIQAKAEAEALQLIADVLRENPELLTYQYIEKLAPGIQVMLVPNDAPYMLPLPEMTPAPQQTPTGE
ncbi:MAG: hypothetical protein GXO56_06680 [Chloroflexi bacterium]|nr:hypothetical protein [Chloroflexota bacterium]